jgi:hypothetical protein
MADVHLCLQDVVSERAPSVRCALTELFQEEAEEEVAL